MNIVSAFFIKAVFTSNNLKKQLSKMFTKKKSDRAVLTNMFNGDLVASFFCAKSKDEYFLFKRTSNLWGKSQAIDSIEGRRVNDDLTWSEETSIFAKGQFFELRHSFYPEAITFETGTKVLALKPTSDGLFSIKFYPATIVSCAKECERRVNISSCNRTRHEYEVKFDD